jgi:hypothetical protein
MTSDVAAGHHRAELSGAAHDRHLDDLPPRAAPPQVHDQGQLGGGPDDAGFRSPRRAPC